MQGGKACTGCGGMFAEIDGPVHRYLESSPACWAAFGEVLAREYADFGYFAVHRLTVDAYAVQHPGRCSPQTIQSLAIHLISLCLTHEHGLSPADATRMMQAAAKRKEQFRWLEPPPIRGEVTISDVHRATTVTEHCDLVHRWASAAWIAWRQHHHTVRRWTAEVCSGQP